MYQCIPNIGSKLRHEFKKFNSKITFILEKSFYTAKGKPRLLPNSNPGDYQLNCTCNGKYIGKPKKKINTHPRTLPRQYEGRLVLIRSYGTY